MCAGGPESSGRKSGAFSVHANVGQIEIDTQRIYWLWNPVVQLDMGGGLKRQC